MTRVARHGSSPQGTQERLALIPISALATRLALARIGPGGIRPGHDFEQPLAIGIFGSPAMSTLLDVFLIAMLYSRFAAASIAARSSM